MDFYGLLRLGFSTGHTPIEIMQISRIVWVHASAKQLDTPMIYKYVLYSIDLTNPRRSGEHRWGLMPQRLTLSESTMAWEACGTQNKLHLQCRRWSDRSNSEEYLIKIAMCLDKSHLSQESPSSSDKSLSFSLLATQINLPPGGAIHQVFAV